jgi:hypothetical protein
MIVTEEILIPMLSKARGLIWLAISALGALLSYLPFRTFFRTLMPDCAPQQIDGQCGLATAFDDLFAVIAAIILGSLIGVIGIRRTRKHSR